MQLPDRRNRFLTGAPSVCLLAGLLRSVPGLAQEHWEQVPNTPPISGETSHHAMVYDSGRNVAVTFGGTVSPLGTAHNETWEWSCVTKTWTKRNPSNSPSARNSHAMAYDSARRVVVLFGGGDVPAENETWEYDGNWVQRFPSTVPGPRIAHGMAYDEARGKVVMFGGHFSGTRLNDTWLWDGNDWVEAPVPALQRPAEREYPVMAYDSNCDVTIMFGGQPPRFNDTWKWDGTAWTQLFPSANPSERYGGAMVYDSTRRKMVMFGGSDSSLTNVDETWEWTWDCSSGTWTQVGTLPRPTGRIHMGLAFDNTCCMRTVLFGGWESVTQRLNDTWLYPQPNPTVTCIPTLSEWGMVAMAGLMLLAGGVVIKRRRAA